MIKVNRVDFLNKLKLVSPGLSSRDFVEQSTSFVFTDGWIITYNDEISCRIKSGLPENVRGAVKAKPLESVLENMADDDVEIQQTESEFLVHGRRKMAGVRMHATIILPVDNVETPRGWINLPPNYCQAVEQACDATGNNDEEFLTVCVHIHPDYMEGCDRKQLVHYEIKTGLSRPFLVRASSLRPTTRFDPTKISETDNWIHIRNKELIYSCRRHLDDYPDMTPMRGFRGKQIVLPRGAIEASKLGATFSSEDKNNDRVLVTLSSEGMVVKGEGANGWAETYLETNYNGPEIKFLIAPKLLETVVASHNECEITKGRMIVRGENWDYTVLLAAAEAPVINAPESEPEPEYVEESASEYAEEAA